MVWQMKELALRAPRSSIGHLGLFLKPQFQPLFLSLFPSLSLNFRNVVKPDLNGTAVFFGFLRIYYHGNLYFPRLKLLYSRSYSILYRKE